MVRLVPRISSAKLQIMVSWIKSFIKGTYPIYSHPSLPSSLRDPDSPPCLPCVYKVRSTGRGANLRQTASNNTAFPRAPRPATLSGHIVWPFPPRLPSSGLGTLVHFFPVFSTRQLCGLRAACPNHPRSLKHWTRKSSDASRAPRCSHRAGLPETTARTHWPPFTASYSVHLLTSDTTCAARKQTAQVPVRIDAVPAAPRTQSTESETKGAERTFRGVPLTVGLNT